MVPLQTHTSRLSVPSSESRATCPLPLVPISGARFKAPLLSSLCHPPTHLPRPSGPRATPLHPRGAATPRARLARHHARSRSVSLSATCVPVVSQRSRNKILIIITITLFTCLDTWPVVCSFSFRLYTLRVFHFRHRPPTHRITSLRVLELSCSRRRNCHCRRRTRSRSRIKFATIRGRITRNASIK